VVEQAQSSARLDQLVTVGDLQDTEEARHVGVRENEPGLSTGIP
jgi:hypothetical protein